MFIVCYLFVPK